MAFQSEKKCIRTCCGENPYIHPVRPACSPRGRLKKKDEEIECYAEDLVSLPCLHDIYCTVPPPKVKDPVTPWKPTLAKKNLTRLEQLEGDVTCVFRQMLQLYKPNEIMVSFNGGKDCTVVLDLLFRFYQADFLSEIQIPVLYIYNDDTFPEVDEFVDSCSKRYNIYLIKYNCSIKEGLKKVLSEYREVKACVMGVRRSDPYCENLKVIQFTDPDWPPLMRINPILDWTYCDVWNYILHHQLPYCPLYDKGYTSLGSKSNTIRNDLLKCRQPKCKDAYFPAYELLDGSMERAGRIPYSAGGFKVPNTEANQE